jgi:cystathionine beta-lyase
MMKFDFDSLIDRTGTHSVKWDHFDMKGEVEDMIPMSIADMDFKAPSFITDALFNRVSHGIFGYTVVPGSYYDSLEKWLKKRFGWEVKREWIRFSPGVIPALNFCVQAFTSPGDKVVIQPPVYHPFRAAIANNGRVVVNNPLRHDGGRYSMDLEGLEALIDGRTKMLILASPHNPVGRVWSQGELKALVDLCHAKGVLIVSDEIHADLIMPGFRHIPTASVSDKAAKITLTCTSPSKTFNVAELHVANIIIPDSELFERFDLALSKAGITRPNIMGLAASEAAYANGEKWVEELLPYLYENYITMRKSLKETLPAVKTAEMEGTYLGWLDFNCFGLADSKVEKMLLTKARVAMTPGRIFGPGGEGFYRINLACPRAVVEEAARRIGETFREV